MSRSTTPRISVIIPVYNVEPYLRRCLDSIVNQTFEHLEIICINDASTDNSAAILHEYAQSDQRIKVVTHTKNSGVSSARNSGMDVATGEYLYFIDSDDWIDQAYLEAMVMAAMASNAPMIMNPNVINEYGNGKSAKFYFTPFAQSIGYKKNGLVSIKEHLDKIPLLGWIFLYNKHFIDTIKTRFPVGVSAQFTYFLMTTLVYCEDIYLVNAQSYHYYHRLDSARGKGSSLTSLDIINIWKLIYKEYKTKNILCTTKLFCYRQLLWYMMNVNSCIRETAFNELSSFFTTIHDDIFNNRILYTELELHFFTTILDSESYEDFKKNIKPILASIIRNSKGKQPGMLNEHS